MPNYNDAVIYKICCDDIDIKNVYIGSTCKFIDRKRTHKNACNNKANRDYDRYVYRFIRENGGWKNWTVSIVDYTPCNSGLELLRIERKYIEKIDKDLSLNIQLPTRTPAEYLLDNYNHIQQKKKEYKLDNYEYLQQKNKEYYEKNKTTINEKRTTKEFKQKRNEDLRKKVKCDNCGFMSNKSNLIRHKTSKRCMEFKSI